MSLRVLLVTAVASKYRTQHNMSPEVGPLQAGMAGALALQPSDAIAAEKTLQPPGPGKVDFQPSSPSPTEQGSMFRLPFIWLARSGSIQRGVFLLSSCFLPTILTLQAGSHADALRQ